MVRRKTAKQPDQTNQTKRCSRRDIILGFWIGLAGAAIYVNVKRKPVPNPSQEKKDVPGDTIVPPRPTGLSAIPTSGTISGDRSGKHRDFLEIAERTDTDKVWGTLHFRACLNNPEACAQKDMKNPKCRVLQGHFYDTIYNKWLGPYSTDDAEPFQFLEIGHYTGNGYEAYKEFMPRAETHSIEIACIEEGPREEGKWPWGNFPQKNPRYQEYLDTNQLHCGDGSDWKFLQETWTTKMKRPDAPPLKVVVEDAAHIAEHMATSLLFWFPKIQPGGILVVEDIQPIPEANPFRIHVVSQLLKDLHYCGDPSWKDQACFPSIWPLLQGIHCELHICVFERNERPSIEDSGEEGSLPMNTLNGADCLLRSTVV